MDEMPIPDRDAASRAVQLFTAHYDAPAYVRRALRVQAAFDQVIGRCRRQRDDWLSLVSMRLGILYGLAGEWLALHPYLANDEQVHTLEDLRTILDPGLRLPVQATASGWVLRRALGELRESLERFNRRWRAFLDKLDLGEVNALRVDYNRYYLLEKECAVRSFRVARQGFVTLRPLTADDVAAVLPPLPVPRLRG
jgi:hypothetical protein